MYHQTNLTWSDLWTWYLQLSLLCLSRLLALLLRALWSNILRCPKWLMMTTGLFVSLKSPRFLRWKMRLCLSYRQMGRGDHTHLSTIKPADRHQSWTQSILQCLMSQSWASQSDLWSCSASHSSLHTAQHYSKRHQGQRYHLRRHLKGTYLQWRGMRVCTKRLCRLKHLFSLLSQSVKRKVSSFVTFNCHTVDNTYISDFVWLLVLWRACNQDH